MTECENLLNLNIEIARIQMQQSIITAKLAMGLLFLLGIFFLIFIVWLVTANKK